jgi:HEAT repeat protein
MRRIRVFSVRAGSLAAIAAFYAAPPLAVAADATRSAEELIEQLSSPSIPVRREATYQLEKLGPQAKIAVPALLKVLDDPDKQVWSNALAAIAAIGPDAKDAIPRLLSVLSSSKNRSGRSERGQMVVRAAYALTQIGPGCRSPVDSSAKRGRRGVASGRS